MAEGTPMPFLRIGWEEAMNLLRAAIAVKYGAHGPLVCKTDYGHDGIGNCYACPDFVDVVWTEEIVAMAQRHRYDDEETHRTTRQES